MAICAPVSMHHVSSWPCILSLLYIGRMKRFESGCNEKSACSRTLNKWATKVRLSFEDLVYSFMYAFTGAAPHMMRKCPIILYLLYHASAAGQFLFPGRCWWLQYPKLMSFVGKGLLLGSGRFPLTDRGHLRLKLSRSVRKIAESNNSKHLQKSNISWILSKICKWCR